MTSARFCCPPPPCLLWSFCIIINFPCAPAPCRALTGDLRTQRHRGHFLCFWGFLKGQCGKKAAAQVTEVVRAHDWVGSERGGTRVCQQGHEELVDPGGSFSCCGLCIQHIVVELLRGDKHCAEQWGSCPSGHRSCPVGAHRLVELINKQKNK